MNQENTKEISVVSPLEFSPAIYNEGEAIFKEVMAKIKEIQVDPKTATKEQLEEVTDVRKKLSKAKSSIKEAGLADREATRKYNERSKAYENDIVSQIDPELDRLKGIEKEAKEFAMMEERKATLPEFKEKLAALNDGIEATDEELLALDPAGRDSYFNERLFAKNQKDREEIEAQKAEQAKEAERIENEKKLAAERLYNSRVQTILQLGFKDAGGNFMFSDSLAISKEQLELLEDASFNSWIEEVKGFVAKENARLAEEAKAKQASEIKAAEEAAAEAAQKKAAQEAAAKEAERLAAEEAEKKAKEEAAAKAAEEKAQRESAERFQSWLNENSYNENTDQLVEEIDHDENDNDIRVTTLYREVSRYSHNI